MMGVGIAVIVIESEFETQLPFDTETEKNSLVYTIIDWFVDPLLHKFPDVAVDESTTESPTQNVVGPFAVISGIFG